MVLVTNKLFGKVGMFKKTKFIDSLRIYVKGGPGGMGLPKYRGIGGKGGDVYVIAKDKQTFLNLLKTHPTKRFSAGPGHSSKARCILGGPGNDHFIQVPVGVSVHTEQGRKLADLNEHEKTVLVAEGGCGGSEENGFCGQKGQTHIIKLDLKLIADVGLVGFPNAGKSSLLKAVSRASPKIASYPFTTLMPQLGVMKYEDFRQISMADLPGLIEGAHYNIGMGHQFLKHLERTKLHIFVVDITGFQLSYQYPWRSAFETVLLLNKELELYNPDLIEKPSVLVINKIDLDVNEKHLTPLLERLHKIPDYLHEIPDELQPNRLVKFDDIIPASAKKGIKIELLRERIRELLDFHMDLQLSQELNQPSS